MKRNLIILFISILLFSCGNSNSNINNSNTNNSKIIYKSDKYTLEIVQKNDLNILVGISVTGDISVYVLPALC